MKRYKPGLVSLALLLVMAVSAATVVYAAGSSDVLKRIYGENAPVAPDAPKKNADGSPNETDMAAWQEYFKFIRDNDPDYYVDETGYEDPAIGDYDFLLAQWESMESLSYSGINKRADKMTNLFGDTVEKYVEEYNKRVKEGTTYVTEDMKAVSLGYFIPFVSFKKAYVATFDTNQAEAEMTQSLQTIIDLMDGGTNAKVEIKEENHFVASYDSEYDDADWNPHPGSVVIDCYYYPELNGAAMYASTFDKETGEQVAYEMFETMQFNDNTFVFQNNTERLILTGSEDEINNFFYSRLKNGEKGYSQDYCSIFVFSGIFDASWINDRDISAYSLVLTREELDYMKGSNGGKFYTMYIER